MMHRFGKAYVVCLCLSPRFLFLPPPTIPLSFGSTLIYGPHYALNTMRSFREKLLPKFQNISKLDNMSSILCREGNTPTAEHFVVCDHLSEWLVSQLPLMKPELKLILHHLL